MIQMPIVTEGISKSVASDFVQKNDTHIMGELEKIKEQNPYISEFIRKYSLIASEQVLDDECPAESMQSACAWCGIVVYKLLLSQAECDWMENTIKL